MNVSGEWDARGVVLRELVGILANLLKRVTRAQRQIERSRYNGEHRRAYCQAHPEVPWRWRHARRAREAVAVGSFTREEFEDLCREFDYRCAYCHRTEGEVGKLVEDHMIPLSRGGTDFIWNIIPACRSCNSSKGMETLEEFLSGDIMNVVKEL